MRNLADFSDRRLEKIIDYLESIMERADGRGFRSKPQRDYSPDPGNVFNPYSPSFLKEYVKMINPGKTSFHEKLDKDWDNGLSEKYEKQYGERILKIRENYFKRAELAEKKYLKQQELDAIQAQKKKAEAERRALQASLDTGELSGAAQEHAKKEIANREALLDGIRQKEKDIASVRDKITQAELKTGKNALARARKVADYARREYEEKLEVYQANKNLLKQDKERYKEAKKAHKEERQRLKDEEKEKLKKASSQKEKKAIRQEYQEKQDEADDAFIAGSSDKRKAGKQLSKAETELYLKETISAAAANATKALTNAVEEGIKTTTSYQASAMARLQGADGGEGMWKTALGNLRQNLAASPYVSFKQSVENMNKLIEAGIAYNLEERAFLSTISDKIATTFDVFDSNLMRLIRLQQADTTAARMGMEANLTKLLNSMFKDTSYLSDVYDSVSQAILEANALQRYDDATAFEYTLQKWLGSLYSLGFSQEAVTGIAQGINALATGNVSALSSNESMQALLAISAGRANTPFEDILVNGLDASGLNSLMREIVGYLQEIADDSKENRVLRSTYGSIFNMSVADLSAVSSLSSKDIENIYNQNLSYTQALGELSNQFGQVSTRMPLGQMLENAFSNAMFTAGEGIANSTGAYVTWLIADTIEQLTGGIHLPAVSVFGNMIDLSQFTIEGLMKTGISGLGLMASIPTIMSALSSGSGVKSFDAADDFFKLWGGSQFTSRGEDLSTLLSQKGVKAGTSKSATYKASGSGKDVKEASLSSTDEDSEEMKGRSEDSQKDAYNVDDFYKMAFDEDDTTHPISAINRNSSEIYKKTESLEKIFSDIYYNEKNSKALRVYLEDISSPAQTALSECLAFLTPATAVGDGGQTISQMLQGLLTEGGKSIKIKVDDEQPVGVKVTNDNVDTAISVLSMFSGETGAYL